MAETTCAVGSYATSSALLGPRHGGGSVACHEHWAKGRLSNFKRTALPYYNIIHMNRREKVVKVASLSTPPVGRHAKKSNIYKLVGNFQQGSKIKRPNGLSPQITSSAYDVRRPILGKIPHRKGFRFAAFSRPITTTKMPRGATLHDGFKEPSCKVRLYTTVPKNRRVKCLAEQLYTTVPKNRRVKCLAEQLYTTVPKNRRVKCLAEQLYTTVPKNCRVKSDFTLRFFGTIV
ncbi:hypothetical protein TIFTF001_026973 [Ficus carica]|uniref:Uncharacterized protein n=1 Tax=Ficus carica TaxID=3494 RepID=A0AA88DM98_FICCA|nr:hypothetical protein TIFTF001_026973 [Ficus carica]